VLKEFFHLRLAELCVRMCHLKLNPRGVRKGSV
jgi:hypothetical protein